MYCLWLEDILDTSLWSRNYADSIKRTSTTADETGTFL